MTILKDYVRAVADRAETYREAEDYYEGRVPERFASARLRTALRATQHKGQQNYCRVVVDSVLHRLSIANVVTDDESAQSIINEFWDRNELNLEADEIHRRALEFGDCYALVWPNANGEWEIGYSSPRTTGVVYDPENPRKKLFATKIWRAAENVIRMNVYFADRIEKYKTEASEYTDGTNWDGIGVEDNPFGEVPVFHFRTGRQYGKPEHLPAYGAQDDINKLVATHMFTVDYQGAPQRYALSIPGDTDVANFDDDDEDRDNLSALKSEPGSLWYLKGVGEVGQFEPTAPDTFLRPIAALKQAIAALTDTPFHYLDRTASVSGGEGLRVSEAPLLKKVSDRQTAFAATWRELHQFVLKAEGYDVRLEIKWAVVESFDSLDEWDVMLKKINAGLSHRQALREAGYEESDIERIMAERAQEAQEGAYYQRAPQARVSTDDNETFQNRNALTEQAKENGGRNDG